VLVQTARLRTDVPSNQYRAKWRSVHLWMNEMENACDKHDHRNAQQGNGEPLYCASRCLFGRWLAHASFLVLCLAPPTCSIERSFSTPHAALPLSLSKREIGMFHTYLANRSNTLSYCTQL
jgi:hypothetical protein